MAEKFLTTGLDGSFYNLPLTVDGDDLLPDQAIARAKTTGTLGTAFATVQEATAARQALEAPVQPAAAAFMPVPIKAPDDLAPPSYTDQDGATALIQAGKRREQARLDAFVQEHMAAAPVERPAKPLSQPIPKGVGIRDHVLSRIQELAPAYSLDPKLVAIVVNRESTFNPNAKGTSGEIGLMQLMPATAQRFGVQNPYDIDENLHGGMKYLAYLQKMFPGRLDLQLAGYNGGEGNVRKAGNQVPLHAGVQQYVKTLLGDYQAQEGAASAGGMAMPGARTAQSPLAPAGQRPASPQTASLMTQAQTSGGTPAQITDAQRLIAHEARLQQQPQGQPFVDMGVGAVTNAQSAATGFLSAIGSAFRTPANTAEAIAPLLPTPVKDITPQMQVLPGLSLGTLTSIWQGLGEAAQTAAQAIEVPEAQKTFANKLSEAAGTMAAYWIPTIATGGGMLVATGLEAFGEANQVYEALKPVVGQDEAAKRAGITAATNLLVLGITNKLGIGGKAKTMVGKTAGGIVGEDVQEVVQYATQQRQFWVPADHPKAAALKAHGWTEANGRVSQPFDAKTVGEILAISSILGGSAAYVDGMVFGLHGTPAEVQAKEARVQARDALVVSREIPQSVVREGYGGQQQPATPLSTPELALPRTAVRGPEGAPLKVLHGTGAVFQEFALEKQGSGEGGDLWGPGLYFAEDPATANRYAERAATDEDTVNVWEQKLRRLTAELPTAPEAVSPETDIFGEIFPTLTRSQTEAEIADVTAKLARIHEGSSNVRPAYLDIRKPFDTTDVPVLDSEIFALLDAVDTRYGPGATDDVRETVERMLDMQNPTWGDIYRITAGRAMDERGNPIGKGELNTVLQDLGYDGIFHIGDRDGRVWIAFRPEQVIPSFGIDAMLQMAREETAALAAEPAEPVQPPPVPSSAAPVPASTARPSQTLGRWRQYVQAELGSVPLPGGGRQDPQPLAQRLQDVGDLIAVEEAFADNPQRLAQLRADKVRLEAELAAAQAAPVASPEAPAATMPPVLRRPSLAAQRYLDVPWEAPSRSPSPRRQPPEEPSALAQHLEGTAPQGATNLRDAQGRWRIPLKNIPPAELELQDFIRQQGGIRLAEETDVPGELRALVTRKETGMSGLQNNASGMTLQQMAERAADVGFLATADKAAMLEAMDRSIRQGETVYSTQATGAVSGIAAPVEAIPTEELPQRPAPPPLSDQAAAGRPVVILSEAQVRMQQRAGSLSNFLPEDRVEFRLPSGETRQGRVTATAGAEVTITYGRRGEQLTVDVLGEGMRSVRLRLTKAQRDAEAAGIMDLPGVLTEQIEQILHAPERQLSGRVTGINFDRIQTPAHVKQYIADMMAASSTYVQEARRGQISRTELLAMAQDNIAKKRFTIDTLLQRQPGQTFSPEDTLAARLIGASVAEEFAARVKQFSDNPTPETETQMLQFIPLANEIFAQWSGLAAEQGRALGAFIPDAYGNVNYIEDIGGRLETMPLDVTTEEFALHLGTLKTTEEMVAALKHVPTWGELFLAGLYGVKLMRLTTDFKNIAGSQAAFLWTSTVRWRAGHVPGYSGAVAPGEASAMLYGWWKANTMLFKLWGDLSDIKVTDRFAAVGQAAAERIGFDDIYDRLKTEGLSGQQMITGANIRARAGQSGMLGRATGALLAGGPKRSALVDFVGGILHFSGAKLNAEDLVAKVYNYMGEGYAQATREAMTLDPPLEGEALSNWMDDYVMNMKGTVKEKAKALAFENTLSERLGPIAANIENAIHAAPLVRLWILFFRTPMNGARWAVRNSPLGRFAAKNQEMLEAGGADADIARARMAMGRDVMMLGALAAFMGMVTGRQPGNPESRKLLQEDAKQPDYSVWIPGLNRWVSYDWLDPVSMVFGMGADLATILKHGELWANDAWENVALAFAAATMPVASNVLSRTWMQGARELFDTMIPNPNTSPEAQLGKVRRLGLSQVRGLNPPPVQYARRLVDPMVRETYTLLDTIMEGVPFMSKSLPPSHNKLGYIRRSKDNLGPDYLIPFQAPAYDVNPVFQELGRLIERGDLSMPETPRKLAAGKDTIDLSAAELSRFQLLIAGGNPSVTGQPGELEVALKDLMTSESYQQELSDAGRAYEVRRLIMQHQDDGRTQLLEELPRLREQIETGKQQERERRYQRPRVGAGP